MRLYGDTKKKDEVGEERRTPPEKPAGFADEAQNFRLAGVLWSVSSQEQEEEKQEDE